VAAAVAAAAARTRARLRLVQGYLDGLLELAQEEAHAGAA
jgi:hypothetical protein